MSAAGVPPPPPPEPTSSGMLAAVDGYRLMLSVTGTKGHMLRAGETQMLQLHVQDASGAPVNRLEPFLQAFAHLHAFYADSETLLQLHPTGGDVLRDDLRGGPSLGFKIFSPQAGPLRIHLQLRTQGHPPPAPF